MQWVVGPRVSGGGTFPVGCWATRWRQRRRATLPEKHKNSEISEFSGQPYLRAKRADVKAAGLEWRRSRGGAALESSCNSSVHTRAPSRELVEPCPEPQPAEPEDQEGPPGSFEEMAWRVHCAVEDMFPMLDAALVRSIQVESPSLQHALDTLLALTPSGDSTKEGQATWPSQST